MIQLLRHQEIDQERWEACLKKAHQPLVYMHAWYLEVVCAGKWDALVEIQGEEYISLFPLPVRTFLGKRKVVQPFFTQQLGLVVTVSSRHTRVEEYLAFLPSTYAIAQYQLPWPAEVPVVLPKEYTWRLRPNFELSLAPDYALLTKDFSTNLRRNVKKALKEGLVLVPSSTISPLLDLFKSTKGQELPEVKDRHYQVLAKLYQRAQQEGVGQVYEVRRQNNLLAAAFLLQEQHRITFLLGASSEEGRTVSAMAFLLNQLIQQNAGSEKIFDFEGSEVPGVAKFYASFGAQPVSYLSLSGKSKTLALPWTLTVFTSLAKRLR